MPLQDLTPQLRTRLNRMERAVGWFILLATLLLLFGFGYYIYKTAEGKGWFALKARYYTYASSGVGLSVEDKVKLMGFDAGQITRIVPMPPRGYGSNQNVYIEFVVLNENSGYIWTGGSSVKFNDSGFLGKRELNLTKGVSGYGTYLTYSVKQMSLDEIRNSPHLEKLRLGEEIYDEHTNLLLRAWANLATNLDLISSAGKSSVWTINFSHTNNALMAMWNQYEKHYEPVTKKSLYELPPDEPPALSDRISGMMAQVQSALPIILQMTNQLSTVLSNAAQLTSNLNIVAISARNTVTNLDSITSHLAVLTAGMTNGQGALGEMLIPTNINQRLDTVLQSVDTTFTNLNTNLLSLNLTLDNLANITSNLNNQVQANTNILSNISDIVVHSDQFIQGLKKFWLFKHLFPTQKTAPAKSSPRPDAAKPLVSPKESGQ